MRTLLALTCCLAATSSSVRAAPQDAEPPCAQVESIGVATMSADAIVTLQIRSLPPRPIAEGLLVYKPGSKDYRMVLGHLGGIKPGQSKPVRPWC